MGDEGEVHGGEECPEPAAGWGARFPELHDLFSAYLAQSWDLVHGTAADALREGIDDRSIDELRAVLEEVKDLLALQLSQKDLQDVLFYDLGSYYRPVSQTQAQWLEQVAIQLDEAVTSRAAAGASTRPDASQGKRQGGAAGVEAQ